MHTSDCKIPVEAVVIDSTPSRLIMPGRDITVQELKLKRFKLADPSESIDYSNLGIIFGVDNIP